MLFQWINISARLCSSFSSSDSSDSDSDNDIEKAKPESTHVKSANPTISNKHNLESFLNNIIQARTLQKTIDVAMQPKKRSTNKWNNNKYISFEKKIISAAEDIANTLGGDKTKTRSDLLEKVLASRVEALRKEQASIKLQKNAKFKQLPEHNIQESSQDKRLSKKSIIQSLLDEYNKRPMKVTENSISRQLNSTKASKKQIQNTDKEKPHVRLQNINLWNAEPSHIFENMGATSPNIPELKIWVVLEQKELKALTTYPPANIFQELIFWTEQGKLWKFPVDNEQGMEEEQSVHFSEHVFLEHHLKEWCPKSGPIRHFMELVCIGLSKNPYLTVQEKIRHIMWYKEYFESKQDLLQEIGAIQEPFPDKVKEITE